MDKARYPFPRKSEAIKTLQRDYCYKKINPEDIPNIIDNTWKIGVDAANKFLSQYPIDQPIDFLTVMREHGLTIAYEDRDYVSGKMRYFADYQTKRKVVTIYKKSVELWARHNGYNYNRALNIILMHEFFHYLEHTELGYISKTYPVYIIKVFGHKFGITGISSLSEIAADAFAETVFRYAFIDNDFEEELKCKYVSATEKMGMESQENIAKKVRRRDIYEVFSIVLTVVMVVFNIVMFFKLPSSITIMLQADNVFLSKWVYMPLSTLAFSLFLYGSLKSETARVQLTMTETIFAMVNIFLTFMNIS